MIGDLPDPAPEECDCHEWFDLDEIGQWPLSALTFTDGQISLDNGVHRWAVAAELGIKRVPVEMIYQSPEPAWAWSWR